MTNIIQPNVDGPLKVEGEIEIFAEDGTLIQRTDAAWLCRCGQSASKPFCDGSHREAGFRGGAQVSSGYRLKNPEPEIPTATLKLTLKGNGPIHCSGEMTVQGADGAGWAGTQANLCRCGQSKNKPFCDGSHRQAGLKAP